jgi:hypothetical protein
MAKNFPYFKFIATEWMTGDIVFESFSTQGLFINICALYWQRNGKLSIEDINKRFKNPIELNELTDRFFSVNDGFISVKFLDEQLIEANHISKVNSENGSKGGRPKKPTANRPLTDRKPKKSKEEKEEEEETEKEIKNNIFVNDCLNSNQWLETVAMQNKRSVIKIQKFIKEFESHLIQIQEQKSDIKEFKKHFVYWLKKQPNESKMVY